ncbi:hypothetical protein ACFQJC_12100 [Haloferax namakaokahaiae]|uniref:DUF7322 domain-containing protein n=1 Tax=Haloferax namakaokahaiae TaxID=1748331 RepID=A0ABD5ZGQ1_9EURY
MIDGERRDDDDFVSEIDPETRWEDAESRWGNPEYDLPNIPSVRIPSIEPNPEEDEFSADVAPEQMKLFWGSVFLANVALAGLSLGPMLIYFRDEWLFGGGALALGIVSLARLYTMYREYESTDWEQVKAEREDDESESDSAPADEDESRTDDENGDSSADDAERNP